MKIQKQEISNLNHNDEGISISEELFNTGVCLPSDANMTKEEQEKVIKLIKKLF